MSKDRNNDRSIGWGARLAGIGALEIGHPLAKQFAGLIFRHPTIRHYLGAKPLLRDAIDKGLTVAAGAGEIPGHQWYVVFTNRVFESFVTESKDVFDEWKKNPDDVKAKDEVANALVKSIDKHEGDAMEENAKPAAPPSHPANHNHPAVDSVVGLILDVIHSVATSIRDHKKRQKEEGRRFMGSIHEGCTDLTVVIKGEIAKEEALRAQGTHVPSGDGILWVAAAFVAAACIAIVTYFNLA